MLSCAGKKVFTNLSDQAPLHIYQCKADYSQLVPIGLSEDKSQIVSYPHPADIQVNGELLVPVKLKNDYWLDRQGIGRNVAFLNISYEEYSKRSSPLPLDSMLLMIRDADPLVNMYQLGFWGDFDLTVKEINRMIRSNQLDSKGVKVK